MIALLVALACGPGCGRRGVAEDGASRELVRDGADSRLDVDDATDGQDEYLPDPADCPTETQEAATRLWGGAVELHLPIGVKLVEASEALARATERTDSTCGAHVYRAEVGRRAEQEGKSLREQRDELLVERGFVLSELEWSEESTEGRRYEGAYNAPRGERCDEPVKAWFRLEGREGTLYWVLLEAHTKAYYAVEPSFKASARSLAVAE